MELKNILSPEIRYFLMIAESGSLSAAARKSGSDVGNLSRSLARLEKTLGDSLFVRHQRGLSLTPRGRELQQAILSGKRAFQSAFRPVMKETLRIGFSPSVGFGFFGKNFLEIIERQGLSPEFTLAPSTELYKLLKERQIDLILSPRVPKFPDIVSAALFTTKLALCSRHGKHSPKILLSKQFFEIERRLSGIQFDESIVVDDFFVAAKLVSEYGDYMGIIPECILGNFPELKVLGHQFDEEKIYAMTWRGSPGMNVLKDIRAALRKT